MTTSPYKKNKEVYNKLGKNYVEAIKNSISTKRSEFSNLFEKGAKILDIGCAGGRDTKFFADKGLRVTGVDFSPVLLSFAKKLAPSATYRCVDIRKMTFQANTFDGIWANAVLHHLKRKDIPGVVKKLHKILKPGGTLQIVVKKGKGEAWAQEHLSGEYSRFFTYFTKTEVEKLLKHEKFTLTFSKIIPDEHGRKGVSNITILALK